MIKEIAELCSIFSAVGVISLIYPQYKQIKDSLNEKRFERSIHINHYFRKYIFPKMYNLAKLAYSEERKRFAEDNDSTTRLTKRAYVIQINKSMNNILLNSKNMCTLRNIGSWFNSINTELNNRNIYKQVITPCVGVEFILFINNFYITLENNDFFYFYNGCYDLHSRKWVNIRKKFNKANRL